ncbi:MAG: GNAT family N-acetyltransferase [Oscillospiraceae bacterium]|nr:GNAT family N-acetyltransferase [Oscillospiraceae bacterium]
MNIIYKENVLTADDFIMFQRKMNWNEDSRELIAKSLSNTVYSIVALKNDEVIGMGRLVGDAAMYWYIQDVFILTQYQGKGIGTEIVKRLIDYVKINAVPDSGYSIYLFAAKGKESFYERLGFKNRPHEYEGAGMEIEGPVK